MDLYKFDPKTRETEELCETSSEEEESVSTNTESVSTNTATSGATSGTTSGATVHLNDLNDTNVSDQEEEQK